MIARGDYRVWVRDTLVVSEDRVVGDVIVIGSTVWIEGRIEGDLVAVQSDVFARPGGVFTGAVIILGGGFYGSALATLDSPPIDASRFDYSVEEPDEGRYLIRAPGGDARLRLVNFYGFDVPGYDRVNALTLGWGFEIERGQIGWVPNAGVQARYRTARSDVDGDVQLDWPFGRHGLTLSGGKTVRSNDRWINAELINSLAGFVAAADYRDYYSAEYVEGGIRLAHGTRTRWTHTPQLQWEDARSLKNQDPFSLSSLRGGFQPNLPVDEGESVSLKWVSRMQVWPQAQSSVDIEVSFEYADEGIAGDFSYTVWGAAFSAQMPTAGRQSLEIRARSQVPGSEGAPRQRWRTLGGWGTLPTLEPVSRTGDRMWWLEATYRIPTQKRLSLLGELIPWLRYVGGNAWSEGQRSPTVHDLGAGLSLGVLEVAIYTDPSASFETVFLLGITPWP